MILLLHKPQKQSKHSGLRPDTSSLVSVLETNKKQVLPMNKILESFCSFCIWIIHFVNGLSTLSLGSAFFH